uniref:Alanyl-tRNA synthetase domain containing 1 n=1 Tax=Pongo abelii TaxID=9601 RepID=A0A8I5T0I0_PONAB
MLVPVFRGKAFSFFLFSEENLSAFSCSLRYVTCGHSTSDRELGRFRSAIELDTPSMTAEQVAAIEQSINEKIRDRLPVNVRELSLDDPEVEQVWSRGSRGSSEKAPELYQDPAEE